MFLNFEPCFPLQSSLAELIWSFNFSAIGRSPSKAPKILTRGKRSFQLSNWEIWGAPWCSFSASCQEEGEWHCRAPFVVRSVCEAGLQIKPIDYERVKISGSKCFGTWRFLCEVFTTSHNRIWSVILWSVRLAIPIWLVHNVGCLVIRDVCKSSALRRVPGGCKSYAHCPERSFSALSSGSVESRT